MSRYPALLSDPARHLQLLGTDRGWKLSQPHDFSTSYPHVKSCPPRTRTEGKDWESGGGRPALLSGERSSCPASRLLWGRAGIRWPSLPLGTPWDVLVRATVQNRKRAGIKIFFIGVRTRTYSDFGGRRNPFFCADSCNMAGNRERRVRSVKFEGRSLMFEVRGSRRPNYAKQSQFPPRRQ
jgi:hypothetical protein